jgi:hypothetical protein
VWVEQVAPDENRCFRARIREERLNPYRQIVTMFTEELPWLRGEDLEMVMGKALCEWLWRPQLHLRLPAVPGSAAGLPTG